MDVGLEPGQGNLRRQLPEDDNVIDTGQAGQQFGPVRCRQDRPSWPFQLPHGIVAIEPDNEDVAEAAGSLQTAKMTSMKKIEASVGPDHSSSLPPELMPEEQKFVPGDNLFRIATEVVHHFRSESRLMFATWIAGNPRPTAFGCDPV